MQSNIVVLAGIIPERPSFSETGDGHPVAEFFLQVRDTWTGKAGQECERPMFILCRATAYQANSIRKYYHPGCHVTVTGSLDQRTYPGEDGQRGQTETLVRVESLSYLSPRRVMEAQSACTR